MYASPKKTKMLLTEEKTKATALPIRNSSFSIIYKINPK